MAIFIIVAALMLVIALTFILVPLLRHKETLGTPCSLLPQRRLHALNEALATGVISPEEYATKSTSLNLVSTPQTEVIRNSPKRLKWMAIITLLLSSMAIGLYWLIGTPQALDPTQFVAPMATNSHGPDMQQAISGLVTKLQENPNDPEGWILLGRAYKATEQFASARDALKRAYDLQPEHPDTLIEYAESLALSTQNHRIEGEPRQLLERALTLDAQNQRGLWLLGISDYQQGHYDAAIQRWNELLPLLPKDAEITQSVMQQIAQARQLANKTRPSNKDATTIPNPSLTADKTSTASDTEKNLPHLSVHVTLAPKLQAQVGADAIVFVFAKAVHGPPMPLAVQRLPVTRLPITLILDDSMSMTPNLKLSLFPQVIVGARISHSGNAMPQSGDLQTLSQPLNVSTSDTIELMIDQVVP